MSNRQPNPKQMQALAAHGADVHDWAVQADGTLRVTMYDDSSVYIKTDGLHDRQRERAEDTPAPEPAAKDDDEPQEDPEE